MTVVAIKVILRSGQTMTCQVSLLDDATVQMLQSDFEQGLESDSQLISAAGIIFVRAAIEAMTFEAVPAEA